MWSVKTEPLTLQVEPLPGNPEGPGGSFEPSVIGPERRADHLPLDARERRHQLVVEGHGELLTAGAARSVPSKFQVQAW